MSTKSNKKQKDTKMLTGSLINNIMDASAHPVPEVGMGCTVIMWTDRQAGTITEVSKSGKSIEVRPCRSIRVDTNGMSDAQTYDFEEMPESTATATYTLRRNGRWVRKGDSMNGQGLAIGYRSTYHDYSF